MNAKKAKVIKTKFKSEIEKIIEIRKEIIIERNNRKEEIMTLLSNCFGITKKLKNKTENSYQS
jgi:hypothetical protein